MAAVTASPPTMSSQVSASSSSQPPLPPLTTNTSTLRRASSQRPTSYAERRMSSFSNNSKASHQPQSRPVSQAYPAVHSNLSYTLVRDFAYPTSHPLHYGPPPNQSGMSTRVSDANRRLSDPVMPQWEESRTAWSATPPWMADTNTSPHSRDQLPAMTFNDGGPPYSEDEDLQSPIVTTTRHRKHKSTSTGHDRGRSPGEAGPGRAMFIDSNLQYMGRYDSSHVDGPGGTIENYPAGAVMHPRQPAHRDSNFAKPLNRDPSPWDQQDQPSEDEISEAEDDGRYSKDYSFTIASPDEEMHGKAVALFDFESEHQNELPLKEGQIVLVSYRHGEGWLVAEDPRTGESGLVPEEFVRLVRDIEGGIHGLQAMTLEDSNGESLLSPISNDPESAQTPTAHQQVFPPHHAPRTSNGSNASGLEKHPAIQSTFSTSSRDFSPEPPGSNVRADDDDDDGSPPALETVKEDSS